MVWAAQIRHVLFGAALSAFFVATAAAAPTGGDVAFTMAAEKAVTTVEREDGFSGVILVARGDKVLLRKAAGFADRKRNIRSTPETKFPLASVTKQFTAAAIMLLVEQGKLSLNDPIAKYYPASPPAWKDITIKHLLTHGSGISDAYEPPTYHPQSYDDVIRLVVGRTIMFQPGTGFLYTNTGYELLSAVIERISGERYGDFLRNHIFSKLGMHNSGVGDVGRGPVKGYERVISPASPQGEWHDADPADLAVWDGAGSAYSTLDDMLTWSRSLAGDRILSTASRDAIFADYGRKYGFGWRFQTKFGRRMIWHTGKLPGFASIFDRFPEEDLTVVALTNNIGLIDYKATLMIEEKETTFQANAARKVVEQVERLYFGRAP